VVAAASGAATAVISLPRVLLELNRSMLRLIEALGSARVTMASVADVAERLERIADELEEPLISLRPGIERLARVLDDDAIDTLPDTLRSINADVLPLIQGLRETQTKVNSLATVLPAASMFFGRRGRPGAPGAPGAPGGGPVVPGELAGNEEPPEIPDVEAGG
jgi:hypothetical protein